MGPEPPVPLSQDGLLSERERPGEAMDLPSGSASRALLLDLDGTLAASLDVVRNAYEEFLRRQGSSPTADEFDRLNGPPLTEIVRRLKDTHGLSGDEDELLGVYRALLDDLYLEVLPNGGARALLRGAREAGWQVGVVTSNSRTLTKAWLSRVNLAGLIDVIVGAEDVTSGKPDPEPYRLALERCRCAPGDAVAVEDSVQGAAAARAAGIRTLLLGRVGPKTGIDAAEAVDSLADVRTVLWP